MTPEEAKLKYEKEWPALHAVKEDAMERGDEKAAKRARQHLSRLSDMYSARFELNKAPEPGIKMLCALENDNGSVDKDFPVGEEE